MGRAVLAVEFDQGFGLCNIPRLGDREWTPDEQPAGSLRLLFVHATPDNVTSIKSNARCAQNPVIVVQHRRQVGPAVRLIADSSVASVGRSG
jgi:hypothetical protein